MPTLQGDGATLEEMQRMSEAANEWMAFVLVTIGVSALFAYCPRWRLALFVSCFSLYES